VNRLPLRYRLLLVILSIGFVASSLPCQTPLDAHDSETMGKMLDRQPAGDPLHCLIFPLPPRLDFGFRFLLGYMITCPLMSFGGRGDEVLIFTRITPEGGKAVLFGENTRLPAVDAAAKPGTLKQNVKISGGFAAGEGKYRIEVLVGDRQTGRTSIKSWNTRVARRGDQRAAEVALAPGSVVSVNVRPWPIRLDSSGKGLRVSIFLEAAPLNPRSQVLRAWDRAFLLEALSSMLKQIPCASVRLRAFNLAQQRELFHQDHFDDTGFIQLGDSLRSLELGTVDYRVLQNHQGEVNMLVDYANRELTAPDPSDIAIFVGPRAYIAGVPRRLLKPRETPDPHFYYFQYIPPYFRPAQIPDAISTLTRQLDGAVFEISSPGDLARAIQKMLARVQAKGSPSGSNHAPGRTGPGN